MTTTLYNSCIKAASSHFLAIQPDGDGDPPVAIEAWLDICANLKETKLTQSLHRKLENEFMNMNTFNSFLNLYHRRKTLHQVFSKANSRNLPEKIAKQCTLNLFNTKDITEKSKIQYTAYKISLFLSEAGWYSDASTILATIIRTSKNSQTSIILESKIKLIETYSRVARLDEAAFILNGLKHSGMEQKGEAEKITYFQSSSIYHFCKTEYKSAYEYSIKAVQMLKETFPPQLIIDILIQAARPCIELSKFILAKVLLEKALLKTKRHCGEHNLTYAGCLKHYAYYLLKVDKLYPSIQVYEIALKTFKEILGENNIRTANIYTDIAYATYAREHAATGDFTNAISFVKSAKSIMEEILPRNHIRIARTLQVYALILEEVAIDLTHSIANGVAVESKETERKNFLKEANTLQITTLKIVSKCLGNNTMRIANSYSNLGRLYQTMKKPRLAEALHLKAIQIATQLNGEENAEASFKKGHLASLYTYEMKKFEKAEALLLDCIEETTKFFGPSHAGLQIYYQNLIDVYANIKNYQKRFEFSIKLSNWRRLRYYRIEEEKNKIYDTADFNSKPFDEIIKILDDNKIQ